MSARCSETKGAGATLVCCRIAGHDVNGHDEFGHCWHGHLMGGLPAPHQFHVRAANAHPLVCVTGLGLDGGA